MDHEYCKFEALTEDSKKKVQEIAVDSKSIESFSNFCAWEHENIGWKIKHGDSNIYSNFLSCLVHSNREFEDKKKSFVHLCENFRFEFLLLHGLRKDESIL